MPDIFVGNTMETSVKNEEKAPSVETKPTYSSHKTHNHTHLFSAYCDNPNAVKVADKIEGEEILLYLRRHFVTNIPWIFNTIGLIIIPFIVMYAYRFGLVDLSFISTSFFTFSGAFYFLIVASYAFIKYLSWFYNVSLVTNKRIIDIDFSSLIYENVEATKLSQVEDVGYSQIGIIRSIFDYGDVNLHTAGPASNFEFLAVPHPEKVINIINNLIGKTKHA